MGVPAFFKWLTLRYPHVVSDAIEEINSEYDINDFLNRKYNVQKGMPEIDNFYLDMNGIIHPCCHPQDRVRYIYNNYQPQPSSEEEMFNSIFDYTDKLIKTIKPKKLIYLAIDGVAPRAKMNQQRSRRFRAAQEAMEKISKEQELLTEWKSKGLELPSSSVRGFDSNVITPGTVFMHKLSKALQFYVSHKLQHDNLWKGLTVVFSDSSVPGEGEHKILEFIRLQRQQDHYDPNTKHCIYGADADLIMLSLITHEPHFYIIRESLNENMWKKCDFCGATGHFRDTCKKLNNPDEPEQSNTDLIHSIQFSLIKVHIVREYLELEFKNLKLQFPYDFERIIDDFVFLCFFVGNDFIPHLPSLKIREGAIDALIFLYKKMIVTFDGYLTEGNGKINLARTEKLLSNLALIEDEIFKRQLIHNARQAAQDARRDQSKQVKDEIVREYFQVQKETKEVELTNKEEINLLDDILNDIDAIIEKDNTKEEDNKLRKQKLNKDAADSFQRVLKEILKEETNKKMEFYKDKVRLGEEGWKDRYYLDKFNVTNSDMEFKMLIKKSYIEGICWVFEYYYNGCASWEWYYPFHYAPFASDLIDIKDLHIEFRLGTPFQPVEQLLSVLPPYSSHALPSCLRHLMHNPNSELVDFYPKDVKLDVNGQPYAWMGVNLVPFIDENRIRKAVKKYYEEFSEDDIMYNTLGESLVFFHASDHFIAKYTSKNYLTEDFYTYFSTPQFRIFAGKVKFWHKTCIPGKTFHKPYNESKLGEIRNCQIVSMIFENPMHQPHSFHLRKGVKFAPKVVQDENLNLYNKRNFKGDQAIDLVRKTLGYEDERNIEEHVRNEVFDRTYNNNRAIEYNPYELDLLRKKRYHQTNDNKNEGNYRNQNYQTNQGSNEYYNQNQRNINYNRQTGNNYDRNRNRNQPYDMQYNQYNNQNIKAINKTQNDATPNNFTNNNLTRNIPQDQNNFKSNDDNQVKEGENKQDVNEVLDNILKSYQLYMGMNKKQ